ncbi:Protein interacting with Hsp90 1 [Yarrowia sp. C11]|nr:Protein interacting with Hsp90 1 [Yarrowia sp. E02]KAG5369866.1 Protein interacting with Hsp90 1 [Yarrowia sp. C11]
MVTVHPKPVYAIKTRLATSAKGREQGTKVFVNVCYDPNLPPPEVPFGPNTVRDLENGIDWHLPVVMGAERKDTDNKKQLCYVWDCVVPLSVLEASMTSIEVKSLLIETCLEVVEMNNGLVLSREFTLPNLTAKGTPLPIKLKGEKGEEEDVNMSSSSESSSEASSSSSEDNMADDIDAVAGNILQARGDDTVAKPKSKTKPEDTPMPMPPGMEWKPDALDKVSMEKEQQEKERLVEEVESSGGPNKHFIITHSIRKFKPKNPDTKNPPTFEIEVVFDPSADMTCELIQKGSNLELVSKEGKYTVPLFKSMLKAKFEAFLVQKEHIMWIFVWPQ